MAFDCCVKGLECCCTLFAHTLKNADHIPHGHMRAPTSLNCDCCCSGGCCPPDPTEDPARKARLEHTQQVLAQMNHPAAMQSGPAQQAAMSAPETMGVYGSGEPRIAIVAPPPPAGHSSHHYTRGDAISVATSTPVQPPSVLTSPAGMFGGPIAVVPAGYDGIVAHVPSFSVAPAVQNFYPQA